MTWIEAKGLSCIRGDRQLFCDLEFTTHPGQALRLVGPNGCGKTSLLRILAGRLRPSCGQVLMPADPLYLDHKLLLKEALTVHENLNFWAKMFNAANQMQLACQQMGLDKIPILPVSSLSAGQKKRVQLALLTLSQASIWLLDEPLLSLDINYCKRLGELAQSHLNRGGLLVYASHDPIPGLQEKTLDLSHPRGYDVRRAA